MFTNYEIKFASLIDGFYFRNEVRKCYGGHTANLFCDNDESILIDKIVLGEQSMTYNGAASYCQNALNGQLWGDIDDPPERTRVINFHSFFHHKRPPNNINDKE